MKKPNCFEKNGELYTLKEGVEFLALLILEEMSKNERIEEIETKRKILDSLSNALIAISK